MHGQGALDHEGRDERGHLRRERRLRPEARASQGARRGAAPDDDGDRWVVLRAGRARLVRADHEAHPEEWVEGDFDQGVVRSNLLRPLGHDRLLRGRVRAGRRPVHITGEDQGRLIASANRGRGLLALRRFDFVCVHPDRVHPALRELRVVRLDDLPVAQIAVEK